MRHRQPGVADDSLRISIEIARIASCVENCGAFLHAKEDSSSPYAAPARMRVERTRFVFGFKRFVWLYSKWMETVIHMVSELSDFLSLLGVENSV